MSGSKTSDDNILDMLDTDATNRLVLQSGSNLTANRILTLTTGDSARTITLNGNPTLDDWFDQSVKSGTSPTFDSANITGVGGGFTLARIAGSTYSTIQDSQNIFHSAGWISGGGITDDTDGTITVAAGTGLIRSADTAVSEILFTNWAAESGALVDLDDNDISWVYVEYNSGTPRVIATTTERTDFNRNILLAIVQRTGTNLHINEVDKHTVGDHANLMVQRMKGIAPYARVSGSIISATGTRNFALSIGAFWQGLTEFSTGAFDSNPGGAADDFSYYYRKVGDSGWNEVTTQTAIHQTNYDDNSGALATLSNNKYGIHWIYCETDGHVDVVYGQGDYTLAQAQDAQPPAGVPESVQVHGFLCGKIIIEKSAAAFTQIESAFTTTFSGSMAQDHGNLVGLTDDDHTQYFLNSTVFSTFTPTVTLVGGAGNTVPVYTTNTGRYVRIGPFIFADVLLTGDGGAEGAGTGQMNIALPVTAGASMAGQVMHVGVYTNNGTIADLYGTIDASGTTIKLELTAGSANMDGNDQDTADREISLKIHYEVDA